MRSICSRSAFAVLVLVALLACKKKTTSDPAPTPTTTEPANAARAKELGPKVKARLALLASLADKVKKEPAVKREKAHPEKLDKDSVLILGDQWLADVHYKPTEREVTLDDSTLALCDYRLEKADLDDDDIGYMEKCTAWKYLAVIRPRRIELPAIKLAQKSFTPGTLQGDMLLFELPSGEVKGRYTMNITNSDEITYVEGKPEAEWLDMAKRDLVDNVRGVVQERLALERDSMGK